MEDPTIATQNNATIRETNDVTWEISAATLIEIADLMSELKQIRTLHLRLTTDLDEQRSALNTSFANLQRERKRLAARTGPKPRTNDGPTATQLAAVVRQYEASHARHLSEFKSARHVADQERDRLRDQSRTLTRRRDALVAHLPRETACRYQALVSRGVERPIAAVDAGACGGCGATLRPLRSKEVRICTSCGRLLVEAPRLARGNA